MLALKLCNLPLLAKIGLSGLLITFGGGLLASFITLQNHYENRDERRGLTKDDITAAYAGLQTPSPLMAVVDGRHPKVDLPVELKPDAAATLRKWLLADRQSENFDNFDFADPTPKDILAASCVSCHGPQGQDASARALALDRWESVTKVAFARKIERTPDKIKAISTHVHATAMATMSVAICGLALVASFLRKLSILLIGLTGAALAVDIGAWWLAPSFPWTVYLIIGGGAIYNLGTGLLLVLIFVSTWLPRERAGV